MFGNFGVGMGSNEPSESIKKILSDKNNTLEDLLRDEELLNELGSKNEKLIKYFDKEKIKQLLDYIIKEPEIDENAEETKENKDKGYKFPFLCSQIFGLQIEELYKFFFMTNKQIEEELNKGNKEKDFNNNNLKEKEKNNKSEELNEENQNKEEKNKENRNDEKKENEGDKNKNEKKEEENNNNENNKEEKKEEEENIPIENKKDDKAEKDQKEKDLNTESNDNTKEGNNKEKKEHIDDIKEEKINEKEKEKESLENRIELIDYLFTFLPKELEDGKKLNYVLCGYFSSMITNLLDMNSIVFLKYIYKERKDIFYLMTTHCYRKSISQALSKVLHYENYFNEHSIKLEEEVKNDMNETRIQVLIDIFTSINIDMDNEQFNSIYYFIIELFEPTNIFEVKDLFKTMIDNRMIAKALIYKPLYNLDLTTNSDEYTKIKRQNLMTIIDIIIFLLANIKKLKLEIPTCSSLDSLLSIKHTKISQEIFDVLPKLIETNFNRRNNSKEKILQSFDEFQLSPLGEYKTKIVSLIYHLIPYFKKISNYFDQILIKTDFLKYAFDFLFEYEWNNLYQESLLSLLKAILDNSASHELLSDYLFNKLKIFEIIKKYTNTEDKFQFHNKDISNNISHGYTSFLISLSYKINTVIGGTPLGVNSNPSTEGSFEFLPKGNDDNDNMDTMNMLYNIDDENEKDKKDNKEEDEEVKKGVPIESMKKYLTDEWRLFFSDNISDVIKQYCNKNWPSREKEMDIFDFLFQDNNDNSNENENEKKEENKDINNENNINGNINENKELKAENGETNGNNNEIDNKDKENKEFKQEKIKNEENKTLENINDIKETEDNKKEMVNEYVNKRQEEVKEEIKVENKEKIEENIKDGETINSEKINK